MANRNLMNAGHFYANHVMPTLIDCNFVVDATNGNGLGIRNLKSNGYVKNVFMHTSAPLAGSGNPNPAVGYVYVQLQDNYSRYLGGFNGQVAPSTGSALAINSTALTPGVPYVIASVGTVPNPQFTIAPVADVSGSLASKYFLITDAFAQQYALYFIVNGSGQPPALTSANNLQSAIAVPVSIATGATAAQVGSALVTMIAALNSGRSFTASGSTTVTVVSAVANVALPQVPHDGPSPLNTGFTISSVTYVSLGANFRTIGLPKGLAPAVGQAFVATASGSATSIGSGTVIASGASGIDHIEALGDPNSTLSPNREFAQGGGYMMFQCMLNSTVTQPANNSVLSLSFYLDSSSVTVDGD